MPDSEFTQDRESTPDRKPTQDGQPTQDREWDGITRAETLKGQGATERQRLADAARAYDWPTVLRMVRRQPGLVNVTRPGGRARWAALHQAAHGGAPVEVVDELVAAGAWRLLRTAEGLTASDLAARAGHRHLAEALTPVVRQDVPAADLAEIQWHFHDIIRGRVGKAVQKEALRLPELEVLRELSPPRLWFPVPGMYGGFSFRLDRVEEDAVLVTESWSRVAGGSGQRHLVTRHGSVLVAEGFV